MVMKMKEESLMYNDYELLYMMYQRDETAFSLLCEKYHRFLWRMIREMWKSEYPVLSDEDVYRILQAKLYDIAFSYCDGKGASFFTYLTLCLTRKIQSLKRSAIRELRARGGMLSLDYYVSEDVQVSVLDTLVNNQPMYDPVFVLRYKALKEELKQFIQSLNEMERKVWNLMSNQVPYAQAAKLLGISIKSYDNAVYRIRKKLSKKIKSQSQEDE